MRAALRISDAASLMRVTAGYGAVSIIGGDALSWPQWRSW
jgi:hypothetical protein